MNQNAYFELFEKLGFHNIEKHKKLKHTTDIPTIYFNCRRDGFVYFVIPAKDRSAFSDAFWKEIEAQKKKDNVDTARTIIPVEGKEREAFSDLLSRFDGSVSHSSAPPSTAEVDGATRAVNRQATERDLDLEQKTLEEAGYFDPSQDGEVRRELREIVARRGQQRFRASLLEGYGGRCVVTGCDAEAALEAAHIVPYHKSAQNDPRNGLLLRADIHTLFDLGQLSINPDSLTIQVDDSLRATVYRDLHGRKLRFVADHPLRPSNAALRERHGTPEGSAKTSKNGVRLT